MKNEELGTGQEALVESAGERLYNRMRAETRGGVPWAELRPAVRDAIEKHAALSEREGKAAA